MSKAAFSVLIVDDEPAHQEILSRSLLESRPSPAVSTVGTLAAFLERARSAPPDVAILDLNLPDGRSIDVLGDPAVKGRFPVLIMTSQGDQAAAVAALRAGALDYIVKTSESFAEMGRSAARALREWELAGEKARTLALLQDSESRYKNMFEANWDALGTFEPPSWVMTGANPSWIKMFQAKDAAQVIGRHPKALSPEFQPDGSRSDLRMSAMIERALRDGHCSFEWTHRRLNGEEFPASVVLSRLERAGTAFIQATVRDISEQKRGERYREIARDVLQILNEPVPLQDALRRIVDTLKTGTGFDAVGIRLNAGDDYPYAAHLGFSNDFIRSENSLFSRSESGGGCTDSEGRPRLECTCGLVISGKTDPANPLFTVGGSFWTNESSGLLSIRPEDDLRFKPRNRCIHLGYASVALVPIRSKDRVVGLLQFNDRRKGRVTDASVEFLENIASHIGAALLRKQAESSAELAFEMKTVLNAMLRDSLTLEPLPKKLARNLSKLLGITWLQLERRGAVYLFNGGVPILTAHEGEPPPPPIFPSSPPADRASSPQREVAARIQVDGKTLGILNLYLRSDAVLDTKQAAFLDSVTDIMAANIVHAQVEERLAHSQKLESVGRLAGGVAHDFNNLLTAINGYAYFVLEGMAQGDPKRDDVKEILASGNRAAELTKQLLAFSRKQILSPQVMDLNERIQAAGRMLRRLIGEDINLEYKLSDGPCLVMVDSIQIDQVLINLAVNAKDAMPDGGTLTFETSVPEGGDSNRLIVRDTGCGMSEQVRHRIFEPFFTTKVQDKGTGLGLSTVYGIIKQSDGDIQVESAPGAGAEFRISLPRAQRPEQAAHAKAAPAAPLRGKELILLVEDEESIRKMVSRTLTAHGYGVTVAANGSEAIKALSESAASVDLLLTDVIMPGMNGRELARTLQRSGKVRRTLFMSGYSDEVIACHGVLESGLDFLGKPFAPDELLKKVRELLDRPAEQGLL